MDLSHQQRNNSGTLFDNRTIKQTELLRRGGTQIAFDQNRFGRDIDLSENEEDDLLNSGNSSCNENNIGERLAISNNKK